MPRVLTAEQKDKAKERYRVWRLKNKARVAATAKASYLRRKEEADRYNEEYRKRNPELIRQINRRCWEKHKDLYSVRKREQAIRKRNESVSNPDEVTPQSQACDICGRVCKTMFDHCHKQNRFRGWLCNNCNSALGLIQDSKQVLIKMIGYIEKHGER